MTKPAPHSENRTARGQLPRPVVSDERRRRRQDRRPSVEDDRLSPARPQQGAIVEPTLFVHEPQLLAAWREQRPDADGNVGDQAAESDGRRARPRTEQRQASHQEQLVRPTVAVDAAGSEIGKAQVRIRAEVANVPDSPLPASGRWATTHMKYVLVEVAHAAPRVDEVYRLLVEIVETTWSLARQPVVNHGAPAGRHQPEGVDHGVVDEEKVCVEAHEKVVFTGAKRPRAEHARREEARGMHPVQRPALWPPSWAATAAAPVRRPPMPSVHDTPRRRQVRVGTARGISQLVGEVEVHLFEEKLEGRRRLRLEPGELTRL
mmetsp:Transcript_120171/g.340166  ORF Transcript_120171/g.340166 Transcript_120171/m.340166 type:complete len:319 (-) Transcript_120171:542-1498(-)